MQNVKKFAKHLHTANDWAFFGVEVLVDLKEKACYMEKIIFLHNFGGYKSRRFCNTMKLTNIVWDLFLLQVKKYSSEYCISSRNYPFINSIL